jgi:transposase
MLHFRLRLRHLCTHSLVTMVLVRRSVHVASLSPSMQKRVVRLRDKQRLPFWKIALRVKNLQKENPSTQNVLNVYNSFDTPAAVGYKKDNYHKCGRSPWKLTEPVQKFLLKRLLSLRGKCICTSTTLQEHLVKEMHVKVDASKIRQLLRTEGFKWVRRSQKRIYSLAQRQERVRFATALLRLTKAALTTKLSMSLDGIVLGMPPEDPTARANHCRVGDTYIWRKDGERANPKLAGYDKYGQQLPLTRAVALWGGISEFGAHVVLFHKTKKLNQQTWATKAVASGRLKKALIALNPKNRRGPWRILCDGETFLRAPASRAAYTKSKVIKLWEKMPAKSPDLNPIEKYWAWLRRRLRIKDLADLNAGREVLSKSAYQERVRSIMHSKASQKHAANIAQGLRKVCKEVIDGGGIATQG